MFVHIDQGIRGPILIWQLKPGFWHAEGVLKARPSPSSSQGLSEIQGSAYSLEVYNCPIQMCVCVNFNILHIVYIILTYCNPEKI